MTVSKSSLVFKLEQVVNIVENADLAGYDFRYSFQCCIKRLNKDDKLQNAFSVKFDSTSLSMIFY